MWLPNAAVVAGATMVFPIGAEESQRLLCALHLALPECRGRDIATSCSLGWFMSVVAFVHIAVLTVALTSSSSTVGQGAIARACAQRGMAVKAFDVAFSEDSLWDLGLSKLQL